MLKKYATVVNNNTPKLYHISFNGDLEGVWYPREPDGDYSPTDDPELYGETRGKRISLAPTIEQCFQGIYANVKHLYSKEHNHLTFHVYTPVYVGDELILTPGILSSNQLVHDAHVTEEHCILVKVKMVRIGKVTVGIPDPTKRIGYYDYGIVDKGGYYGWLPSGMEITSQIKSVTHC